MGLNNHARSVGSTIQRAFKFIRLGVGFCLVLFAIFLLRPDSEYIQQMLRLEYEGQSTEAKLIDKIEGRSSSATKLPPGVGGALVLPLEVLLLANG